MHRCVPKPALAWLLTGLLLGACSSAIPPLIREAPADNPSLEAVRANTGNYLGRQVRWGGRLIAVENRVETTWLTVLERPLRTNGEPGDADSGGGRFIAVVPAFLDPGVYTADRLVTVTGILSRTEIRKVGEFPYHYPVVQAQDWYLWPVEYDGYPYRDWRYDPWYGPWWYDPWYDPWWYRPWYGTRYYRHWEKIRGQYTYLTLSILSPDFRFSGITTAWQTSAISAYIAPGSFS
jgi:outer membrane lipoprotein